MTNDELKALGYPNARCPECGRTLRMGVNYPEYCLVTAKGTGGEHCIRYPAAVIAILKKRAESQRVK
jgi:hypothetical protein